MVAEAPRPEASPGAGSIRLIEGEALDPLVQPQCSLAVQLRRATGSIVGRSAELAAIAAGIRDAKTRLNAVTLEGEPGIGKTRLLVATAEMAEAAGFITVAITADEEIRGPFLVGRSMFANGAIRESAVGTRAEVAVRRVADALSGRNEPGFEGLSADARLLRAFDLAGIAIGELARMRPIALLLDDVQWADDDTLRLLRYVVRSVADEPVFLFLTFRPDEFAAVPEAANFVADMERMGLVRRLRVTRFTASETSLLLKQVLGGPVEGGSAAAMQTQSEGVPFIVEELARAHREAGTLQQVDGEWRLGRNAARLVPSAVRTLISRRATHLPPATLAILGDAGILGRSFSVRDILAIRERVGAGKVAPGGNTVPTAARAGEPARDVEAELEKGLGAGLTAELTAGIAAQVAASVRDAAGLGGGTGPGPAGVPGPSHQPVDPSAEIAASLAPAVEAGLLIQHPAGDAADYTFSHEQVREFAVSQLSNARRREVHRAVVDLLLEGGDAPVEGLQMLAQHALAAGDHERAARFSIDAAAAALKSNAPEEALRLVDAALPVVSAPGERRILLTCRDDAYAVLRRSSDRLDGLAELGALAEALRDPALELDVQLRRAATFRVANDDDAAAELARRVIARAASLGDKTIELRATLELGQALSRTELGDSFGVSTVEVDAAGAEEAFRRAIELAEEVGDERALAASLREVGSLVIARLRTRFVTDIVKTGAWQTIARRLQAGEEVEDVVGETALGPMVREAGELLERALGIFERLDDRSGVMATIIAMAYLRYAPLIHLSSSVRHLEEIKRVISRQAVLVTESERARQELHLLYGIHVYARAKSLPDAALSRGEEAYRAARLEGQQAIQFSAAGGVALTHLQLGDVAEAERWLEAAAEVASSAPTPTRSRQLSMWRGMARAAAGDASGMRANFERAVELATAQSRPAARCEALTKLAVAAARLGSSADDQELLALAESSALDAKGLAAQFSGHAQWASECDAAIATVLMARGETGPAVASAFAAIQALAAAEHEDVYPDVFLPASEVLLAAGPPEAQEFVRGYLQVGLSRIVQGTLDESIRVRWLKGPIGSRLVALAGGLAGLASGDEVGALPAATELEAGDRELLVLMTEGLTNGEMADRLGVSEASISTRLARILVELGASDRAQATTLAMRRLGAALPVGAGQGLASA
jgi:DNA-binding CsgD family transcriptional regulator/tetratricopeptide (TPR) repeat protein